VIWIFILAAFFFVKSESDFLVVLGMMIAIAVFIISLNNIFGAIS
jgi:hypothetical protein